MNISKLWKRLRPVHRRRPTRSQLAVNDLENRLVPTVLTFDLNATVYGNDGAADTILARRTGDNLEIVVNGSVAESHELSGLTGLRIVGSDDDEGIASISDLMINAVINGGGGVNTFTLLGTPNSDHIGVRGNGDDGADVVIHTGTPITYTYEVRNVSSVNVDVAGGDDLLSLHAPSESVPVELFGGTGANTLRGFEAHSNEFVISGPNSGSLFGQTYTFSGWAHFEGGYAGDFFRFQPGGFLNGDVDGRNGHDTLDFSAFGGPIYANLTSGVATGIGGRNIDIENVNGGRGNDFLIGSSSDNTLIGGFGHDVVVAGDGADRLEGGHGRDILIGGFGSDVLLGGAHDDLMFGASTVFDSNMAALTALRDIWGTARYSYDQQVSYLRNVGVGGIRLDAGCVIPDTDMDWLVGGAGRDWFWADSWDVLVDLGAHEEVN